MVQLIGKAKSRRPFFVHLHESSLANAAIAFFGKYECSREPARSGIRSVNIENTEAVVRLSHGNGDLETKPIVNREFGSQLVVILCKLAEVTISETAIHNVSILVE